MASIDQKFQSIKLKYTQSHSNLNVSPLRHQVSPIKALPSNYESVNLQKHYKKYDTAQISPLRVKNDQDFRLSEVKHKLKEYQSLPRCSTTERKQIQRTFNKEVSSSKQSQLIDSRQIQEDTKAGKGIINETVPQVIPQQSSQKTPQAISQMIASPPKRFTKEKYDSPVKRYKYLNNNATTTNQNIPPPEIPVYFKKSPISVNIHRESMKKTQAPLVPSKKENYHKEQKKQQYIKEQQNQRTKAQTVQKQKNKKAIKDIDALLLSIKSTISKPISKP